MMQRCAQDSFPENALGYGPAALCTFFQDIRIRVNGTEKRLFHRPLILEKFFVTDRTLVSKKLNATKVKLKFSMQQSLDLVMSI